MGENTISVPERCMHDLLDHNRNMLKFIDLLVKRVIDLSTWRFISPINMCTNGL